MKAAVEIPAETSSWRLKRVGMASWPLLPFRSRWKTAAVIGGGPAGLAAAYFLARGGVTVTVFDKNPAPGGLVRTFLCDKKGEISTDAIDKDVALIQKLGVRIVSDKVISSFDELDSFDYVWPAAA